METETPLSRRERNHLAAVTDIKESALAHVVEVGPDGLSLRSVARDVGLAPSAIYRYFESREALLDALARDALEGLADAVGAAEQRYADARPAYRFVELATAYRAWCHAHPGLFGLLFSPQRWASVDRVELLSTFAEVYRVPVRLVGDLLATGSVVVAPGGSGDGGSHVLEDVRAVVDAAQEVGAHGTAAGRVPSTLLQDLTTVWIGLHGFVGFELTGSARLVFDDPEAVFTDLAHRGFAQLFVEADPGTTEA